MYSENFKHVTEAIIEVIDKQEQMHDFHMQTSREIGADVMFFSRGIVAIEPTLSCSGKEIAIGKEVIKPEEVAKFLISCSTSFRENYNATVDTSHKTPIIHITKKAE